MSAIVVRPVELADHSAWDVLWKGYVTFYEASVTPDVTECLWWRLHDASTNVKGLVALTGGQIVGLAHYVLSPNTWGRQYICYLEDIFVSPEARGQGIARNMLEWLRQEANRQGWTRLYWMTHSSNKRAQKLYDEIAERTQWIRYDLNLSKPVSV